MQNYASLTTRGLFTKSLEHPSGYVPPDIQTVEDILREFQDVLHKALVDRDPLACGDCGELKALIAEAEEQIAKAGKDSDAVRACVAKKIPMLMDEGKPQKQAVAIALSMCREDAGAAEKSIEKAGTSEGAKKAWQKRKRAKEERRGIQPWHPVHLDEEMRQPKDDPQLQQQWSAGVKAMRSAYHRDQSLAFHFTAFAKDPKDVVTPKEVKAKFEEAQDANDEFGHAALAMQKAASDGREVDPKDFEQLDALNAQADQAMKAALASAREAGVKPKLPEIDSDMPPGMEEGPYRWSEAKVSEGGKVETHEMRVPTDGDDLDAVLGREAKLLSEEGFRLDSLDWDIRETSVGEYSHPDGRKVTFRIHHGNIMEEGNEARLEMIIDTRDYEIPTDEDDIITPEDELSRVTPEKARRGGRMVNKALGDEMADPQEEQARAAAEAAGAGAQHDDITSRALDLVASAMAKVDPDFSERAKRAWETRRRKGEGAKPDQPAGAQPGEQPEGAPAPGEPAGEAPAGEAPAQPGEEAPAQPAAAAPARPANPHRKAKVSEASTAKVQVIMGRNGLTNDSEEMEELAGFKSTLGQRGRGRSINELKADFVNNMDPSNYTSPEAFRNAQQRIKAMNPEDFGKVLAAIHEEEEEIAPVQAGGIPQADAPAVSAPQQVTASFRNHAESLVKRALNQVLEGSGAE